VNFSCSETVREFVDDLTFQSDELLILDNAEFLVSFSPRFQSWVGAVGGDLAAKASNSRDNHIHQVAKKAIGNRTCIVSLEDNWTATKVARHVHRFSGAVFFQFIGEIDPTKIEDPEAAWKEFTGNIGVVIKEMLAITGTDEFIDFTKISALISPMRNKRSHQDEEYIAVYMGEFDF